MKNIRNAPDFFLISNDYKEVFLVETKFRNNIDFEEMRNIAYELSKAWSYSYVFLATKDNFYMDLRLNIIKNNGRLEELIWNESEKGRYVEIVREYIK